MDILYFQTHINNCPIRCICVEALNVQPNEAFLTIEQMSDDKTPFK